MALAIRASPLRSAFSRGLSCRALGDLDRDVVERAEGLAGQRQLAEHAARGQGLILKASASFDGRWDLAIRTAKSNVGVVAERQRAFSVGPDQVGLELDLDGRGEAVHHRFRIVHAWTRA